MNINKKIKRLRRARCNRKRIQQKNKIKLSVYKSARHIYAQIIDTKNDKIIISASTLEHSVKKELLSNYSGNKQSAFIVGRAIAKKALAKKIIKVSFDRSGFLYHGRIKELAESARKHGLIF